MQLDNIKKLWKLDTKTIKRGGWLWWFWLFFIDNPRNPKKPAQLMILWSINRDKLVYCNDLQVSFDKSHKNETLRSFTGTVGAWYFDGDKMHDDFLLENCKFTLDEGRMILRADGKTQSSFSFEGDKFVVDITRKDTKMHFVAKDRPNAPFNEGLSHFLGGAMNVHGIQLLQLPLEGKINGKKITGSSYFQKILMNAPPPCWFWGIFHYKDGSRLSYMNTYAGRAMLKDNAVNFNLKTPSASITQYLEFFDAKKQIQYDFKKIVLKPKKAGLDWVHEIFAENKDYTIEVSAKTYAHACWEFKKNLSFLPVLSKFKYNEYPAMAQKVKIKNKKTGEESEFGEAVGNIEQSWGMII